MKNVGRTKRDGDRVQQKFLDTPLTLEMRYPAAAFSTSDRAVDHEWQPRFGGGAGDRAAMRYLALGAVGTVVGGHRERRGGTVERGAHGVGAVEVGRHHLRTAIC